MAKDWQVLTRMTGGAAVEIDRVRVIDQDVVIEGPFELPPLARLAAEDQIFVAAFVGCHGSIKQMEKFFDVSYPTIKSRLNRIASALPGLEIAAPVTGGDRPPVGDLLTRLERGEMSVDDVLLRLRPPLEKP